MSDTKDGVLDAIRQRNAKRRDVLKYAGQATAVAGGLTLLSACGGDDYTFGPLGSASPTPTPTSKPSPTPSPTSSSPSTPTPTPTPTVAAYSDTDILNFALNLEYLTGSFFSFASTGAALDASLTTDGSGGAGGTVSGGTAINYSGTSTALNQMAAEILAEKKQHITYLRGMLKTATVAIPAIDIQGNKPAGPMGTFATGSGFATTFSPYALNKSFVTFSSFLLDITVTAYKGLASVSPTASVRDAVLGLLSAASYHAAAIRTFTYIALSTGASNGGQNTGAAAEYGDTLDGSSDDAQGVAQGAGATGGGNTAAAANIVPADANGLIFGRDPKEVLNILYLTPTSVSLGGFLPAGFNGGIKTSAAN